MTSNHLDQLFDEFLSRASEAYHSTITKPFSILIVGKTGVGKSTLINTLFGEYLSRTGVGLPVTGTIEKYQRSDIPISVYDTPGLEMHAERNDQIKSNVIKLITGQSTIEDRTTINIIWYCIDSNTNRFEEAEEEWLREISNQGLPVILVLTKTLSLQGNDFLSFLTRKNVAVYFQSEV